MRTQSRLAAIAALAILLAALLGYALGLFGFDAVGKAKAYNLEASKLYKQSNTLYDASRVQSCKAYGLLVASCYAGTSAACSMMPDAKDAFHKNYNVDPFDTCGLDK